MVYDIQSFNFNVMKITIYMEQTPATGITSVMHNRMLIHLEK